jgi:uncharacterized protein (TIGR03437 family)
MKNTVLLYFCAIGAVVAPNVLGQSPLNTNPSRVVGQPFLNARSGNPNVPEGREFQGPLGIAIDSSSTPSAVYVADTGNNRVLCWKNSSVFTNGQPADFVIGQLDKYSTSILGPGTGRSTGLYSPVAVAVDPKGNLYVADAGNNRILRYPKPTASTDDFQTPDMVIGQTTFSTNAANNGGLSERTIALAVNGVLSRSAMVFDAQGNLFLSDTLNNRVLRYPVAALNAGGNAPAADMVIGQISFSVNTAPPVNGDSVLNKVVLLQPSGLALDPSGRLYVCDSLNRCLVYPTLGNGATASRVMGIPVISNQPNRPPVTEYTLTSPEGIFMIGNNPVVCDAGSNRLLRYDAYETWPAETPTPASTVTLSPPAKGVIGQSSFGESKPNKGLGEPNEFSLYGPVAGAMAGTDMFIVDSGNNRVLVFPSQATASAASRVLGQDGFAFNAVNLAEGKEMFLYAGVSRDQNFTGDQSDGAGVVVDFKSSTPRLYIADTFNNRILGYKDARRVRPGDKADIVIGQADFSRTIPNAPQGNRDLPMDVGLFRPSGLAVDANGALWVCDSGNARVLRFGSPFDQSGRIRPNLVIGQTGLFAKVTDTTRANLAYPTGVGLTTDGHLLVSDAVQNRVLFFRKPTGGDFTNGQQAEKVIGQSDFNTGTRSQGVNRFSTPRQIAVDTDDRLYVADSGNNRIVIYDRVVAAPNDPQFATTIPSLNTPQGIYVSPLTGEIWVADTRGNRALRFPRFDRLALNPASEYSISASTPLAVTQDGFGNLYIAESINRVSIFYNGLATTNAANGNDLRIAPGMIASVYPRAQNVPFGDQTAGVSALPMPTTLGDVQVLIDDKPVPLYYVSPGQINFLVPMGTATSGTAEFQVVKASLGQVLASGSATLDRVAPALFTTNGGGTGQLAAINADDNTPNSPTNMIGRSKIITLYGTGGGYVTGAPPDGVAPTGAINIDANTRVIVGTDFVPPENVLYSGLAPGFPGLWQINVKIPDSVLPSAQVPVVAVLNSISSNNGKGGQILRTTISVKQ